MSFYTKIQNLFKDYYVPTTQQLSPEPTKSVMAQLIEKQDYRIRQTIQTWRTNLVNAENGNRQQLLKTYEDIMLDTHLTALIELKKDKLSSMPFKIYQGEDIDEEGTKMFKQKWFFDIIDIAVDSMFYGHSLIQLSTKDFKLKSELIPRKNVNPETQEFFTDYQQNYLGSNGIDYTNPLYYTYLVDNYYKDKKYLGLLSQIAPIAIYKKMAIASWAEYSEIFGQPVRVGKMASTRPEDREEFAKWLKNLGKNAYAILGADQTIEFQDGSKSDAFNIYLQLSKYCDEQMSKVVLGSTMTTDGGASYSQSQTHAEQTDVKTAADMKYIEFFVNDILIPKLVGLGLLPEGTIFSFENTEKISLTERMAIDSMLLQNGYRFTTEYLQETYGTDDVFDTMILTQPTDIEKSNDMNNDKPDTSEKD